MQIERTEMGATQLKIRRRLTPHESPQKFRKVREQRRKRGH